jgi:hypothetical protein
MLRERKKERERKKNREKAKGCGLMIEDYIVSPSINYH